ncbi:unnamed protein product [Clonostachys chloroleuca]|uniref:Zn(2)-C6 fungal-type domain-containing protein n=1 Tax=Clonostachys chloroleuca TaxID=1926264 RepID=A0AA35QBF4_9HYPO|nr:unnamed protein product [Clonostachys chloroleuca]
MTKLVRQCDEQRPCKNCVRFGVVCSLVLAEQNGAVSPVLHSSPPAASSPTPTFLTHNETSPAASPIPLTGITYDPHAATHVAFAPPPSVHTLGSDHVAVSPGWTQGESQDFFSPNWIQSLQLLHHYDTVVYKTLTRDQRTESLWRYTVPEIAFTNVTEALLQAVLALSALNYAIRNPDQHSEFIIVSSRFQSLALQHFSANLHNINEHNCKGYFLLATFVFLLTMCSTANASILGKIISPIDVAQSLVLLQGIKTIMSVKSMDQWKADGPLSILLDEDNTSEPKESGPYLERLKQLSDLARKLEGTLDPINEQTSCILAIETLRSIHVRYGNDDSPSSPRRVWVWPMTLTQMFIDLISQGHPVALIILGHFTALVRPYESPEWVNRGWSEVVFQAAESSLSPEWKKWIEWPKKSIKERINVNDMPFPETIEESWPSSGTSSGQTLPRRLHVD